MSLQAARRLRYTIREKLTLIFRHNDEKYYLNTNGTKTETQLEVWSKKLIICKRKLFRIKHSAIFWVFFFSSLFYPHREEPTHTTEYLITVGWDQANKRLRPVIFHYK